MDAPAVGKLVNHPDLLSLSLDQSADMLLWIGDDGRLLHANRSALERFDLSLSALRQITIHELDGNFKPESWAQHWAALKRLGTLKVRVNLRDAKACFSPVDVVDTFCRIDDYEFSICVMRDVSYHDEQHQRMELMQFSMDQMADTVLWIDKQAHILFANDAACRNLGYAHDELKAMTIADIDPNYPSIDWPHHWVDLKMNKSLRFESRHLTKDGRSIPIEVHANFVLIRGEELNVAFIRDISDRKMHEQQLIHLATHDGLTGLPNRDLLYDRIDQAVARAKRNQTCCAVLMVGLDDFKMVNDTYGHDAGDVILTATASRMQSALRATDTVARHGGDEFVVLLDDLSHLDDAEELASKLLRTITEQIDVGIRLVEPGASIGIAYYPVHGGDARTLLKNADIAIHQAKKNGGGSYQVYHQDLSTLISKQMELINGLKQALDEEEFELHYQPVYRLSDNSLVACEALLRWRHPEGNLVPPVDFIPLAEESGLIVPIGSWVIHEACRQNRSWANDGYAAVPVAVNLSARQLRSHDIVSVIKDALKQFKLDSSNLSVELTESMMMDNPEKVIKILKRLEDMGVTIAIDDFGTGYSSLSYLQSFPVNVVKIDRSFVQVIGEGQGEAVITNAIIQLGHSMGFRVLAEGIETEFQRQYLIQHGCDLVQGFHFGRPVPAAEFETRLGRP